MTSAYYKHEEKVTVLLKVKKTIKWMNDNMLNIDGATQEMRENKQAFCWLMLACVASYCLIKPKHS